MTDFYRDHAVLVRWTWRERSLADRVIEHRCVLIDLRDDGPPVGVFERAGDGNADSELVPPAALAAGMVALREALQRARRVVTTGAEEREAWTKSAQRAGVELEAFADESSKHANAYAEFTRMYGPRYPITEDLMRGQAKGRR